MSAATAERSFSKLKLIKTYLRSTMGQERLNGLALLSIEKDLANRISYDKVIDKFAHKKSGANHLFCKTELIPSYE